MQAQGLNHAAVDQAPLERNARIFDPFPELLLGARRRLFVGAHLLAKDVLGHVDLDVCGDFDRCNDVDAGEMSVMIQGQADRRLKPGHARRAIVHVNQNVLEWHRTASLNHARAPLRPCAVTSRTERTLGFTMGRVIDWDQATF